MIEYIADCVAKRKALKAKLEVEQGTEARQFLREQLTFLQEQLTFLQGQLMELLKMENRLAGAQSKSAGCCVEGLATRARVLLLAF